MFAFVKIGLLFADVHDDLWASGSGFVVPPARWSGAGIEAGLIRGVLLAAANNQGNEACTYNVQQTAGVHESGYLCAIGEVASTQIVHLYIAAAPLAGLLAV